jgi:hypothetical protein
MKKLVLLLIGIVLFSYNVVYAAFGVNLDTETFEGTFPPPGWAVDCHNDPGSIYGCWEKGSGYGSTGGFSGSSAQCIYGDYLLDTSLISPAFSTMGFSGVNLVFSGYFYFYSGYGNVCDLQYSTNGGSTWTTFKTWGTYGNSQEENIALPAEALGQANVILRWHRYTNSYPYYYGVVDNVKLTSSTPVPTSVPTLSEWGMIIMSLLLAGSAIWMIRRRQTS